MTTVYKLVKKTACGWFTSTYAREISPDLEVSYEIGRKTYGVHTFPLWTYATLELAIEARSYTSFIVLECEAELHPSKFGFVTSLMYKYLPKDDLLAMYNGRSISGISDETANTLRETVDQDVTFCTWVIPIRVVEL